MSIKQFDSLEIIDVLLRATVVEKIFWTRISDYSYYNARNKALMNFVDLFSRVAMPSVKSDPASADLTQSYYSEYSGAAFCLMYCYQVFNEGQSPEHFYHLMIQKSPYDNFKYYSLNTDIYQNPINMLVSFIQAKIAKSLYDPTPLHMAISELENAVVSQDTIEPPPATIHADSSSYKHCSVIDKDGMYVEFVLVNLNRKPDGSVIESVYHYSLKDDEQLLDVLPPTKFVKARWNGTAWEEGASQAEIEEYRKTHRY